MERAYWTEFFGKPLFQGSHFFLCVGKGRVVMTVVCVGGSKRVSMRFVVRSLGVGMGVCLGCGRVGK